MFAVYVCWGLQVSSYIIILSAAGAGCTGDLVLFGTFLYTLATQRAMWKWIIILEGFLMGGKLDVECH